MKKLLFILVTGLCMAGCKKQNAGNGPASSPSVVGTWNAASSIIIFNSTGGELGGLEIGITQFTFNNDGTVLETFTYPPQTTYNYTFTNTGGVHYVTFSQADGPYINDEIRTLNNEKFMATFDPDGRGLTLTRVAPLAGANATPDPQTVINLLK
jgi:hypothetical protein